MVESGLNHYTSRFGRSSIETGLNIWRTASQLGSKEAEIRLTASRVLDSFGAYNKREDFKILKKASDEGSLFAMVSVGLCYLQGLGIKKSIPDAVNYFRSAAQRGSRFAYEELKRIYDDRRPTDSEFRISN
jgi:TPR repeat protein